MNGVPAELTSSLRKENAVLQQKAQEEQRARKSLSESLRAEARTNEEQRVYISVLEEALKVKAGELGLSGHADGPNVLAELARLRADAANKESEVGRMRGTVEALETECKQHRRRGDEDQRRAVITSAELDAIRSKFGAQTRGAAEVSRWSGSGSVGAQLVWPCDPVVLRTCSGSL